MTKKIEKKEASKKRNGDKYLVLIPFSIGIGKNKVDYKKDDNINLQVFEAKQFINSQKIKKC